MPRSRPRSSSTSVGLTEAAGDESQRIIGIAEEDAAGVRRGADDYAAGVLAGPRGATSRGRCAASSGDLDARRAARGADRRSSTVEDGYERTSRSSCRQLVEDEEEASAAGRR